MGLRIPSIGSLPWTIKSIKLKIIILLQYLYIVVLFVKIASVTRAWSISFSWTNFSNWPKWIDFCGNTWNFSLVPILIKSYTKLQNKHSRSFIRTGTCLQQFANGDIYVSVCRFQLKWKQIFFCKQRNLILVV